MVGANGVGKSTLLKIIVGELEPDSGNITLKPNTRLGYLPQVLDGADNLTVDQLILAALAELQQLEARLREIETSMATATSNLDALLSDYGQVSEQFERRGGYDLERRRETILAGLQIDHINRERLVGTLSGGEKSRVGLAALLLQEPDLLLLDEPTNHLDFTALAWLEGYLRDFRGGLLAVSHDRQFLNQTVNTIVEIVEQSKEAKLYQGNYDFYAQVKAQERVKWEESYWAQQEEIWELRKAIKVKARQVGHGNNRAPRDNDKFIVHFKSQRVDDAVARNLHAAEEKLRRIEEDPIPKPVAALSVGQKRKLQVASLLTQRANLLLLDEPTNHISLDVLEEFEQALSNFAGPVIAVSHDRRFIQRFAREIWELADGKLKRYLGGWEEYRTSQTVAAIA